MNRKKKSVRIRSYSGPHFPAFGLNTERYGVSLRIRCKCGKMRTRISPNTDIFYAAISSSDILDRLFLEKAPLNLIVSDFDIA